MSQQVWIVVIVAIVVLLVALYAISKGRGIRISAEKGKVKMDVTEEKELKQDSERGPGSISDVTVSANGNMNKSVSNIHIGHSSEPKKG